VSEWHESARKYREELSQRIVDVFDLDQVYTHDDAKKLLEAAGSDDPREDIRVAIYQHDLLLRNDWTVVRRG
jgi:hypothetical protein